MDTRKLMQALDAKLARQTAAVKDTQDQINELLELIKPAVTVGPKK